jgi:hypothetical protein
MNTTCPEIDYNQILDSTPTKIILNNSEFTKITGEPKSIESEIEEYILQNMKEIVLADV